MIGLSLSYRGGGGVRWKKLDKVRDAWGKLGGDWLKHTRYQGREGAYAREFDEL